MTVAYVLDAARLVRVPPVPQTHDSAGSAWSIAAFLKGVGPSTVCSGRCSANPGSSWTASGRGGVNTQRFVSGHLVRNHGDMMAWPLGVDNRVRTSPLERCLFVAKNEAVPHLIQNCVAAPVHLDCAILMPAVAFVEGASPRIPDQHPERGAPEPPS